MTVYAGSLTQLGRQSCRHLSPLGGWRSQKRSMAERLGAADDWQRSGRGAEAFSNKQSSSYLEVHRVCVKVRRLTTKFSDRARPLSTRARQRSCALGARPPAAGHFMVGRLAATQS